MRSIRRMSTLRAAIAVTLKRWMWLGPGISLILLTGTGANPEPTAECPMPSVPVILDGVRYELGELDGIRDELCGKDLIYTVAPESGDFHAFTTAERFNEWAAKNDLPAFDNSAAEGKIGPVLERDGDIIVCAPTDSPADCESRLDQEEAARSDAAPLQACPPPSSYFSRNWEHINCGGVALSVAPKISLADLRNVQGYNWNDRISSVQAANGGVFYESLFEHINFQGSVFIAWAGYTYPELGAYGWNDRASSLKTVI